MRIGLLESGFNLVATLLKEALPAQAYGRLASLQGSLKCGSNCGSCLPELKRRVRDARSDIPIKQQA